jgi:hypothetical protein
MVHMFSCLLQSSQTYMGFWYPGEGDKCACAKQGLANRNHQCSRSIFVKGDQVARLSHSQIRTNCLQIRS